MGTILYAPNCSSVPILSLILRNGACCYEGGETQGPRWFVGEGDGGHICENQMPLAGPLPMREYLWGAVGGVEKKRGSRRPCAGDGSGWIVDSEQRCFCECQEQRARPR